MVFETIAIERGYEKSATGPLSKIIRNDLGFIRYIIILDVARNEAKVGFKRNRDAKATMWLVFQFPTGSPTLQMFEEMEDCFMAFHAGWLSHSFIKELSI